MQKLMLKITLLINLTCFCYQKTVAQCHIDDWKALKALYESTDGNNWTNNSGWEVIKETVPPADCNFDNLYGVNSIDSRVVELYLISNKLNGSIPTEIGNLTYLISLNLSNNQLSGSIPTEIGNLSSLNLLWLSNNQLSGSIPKELGNLIVLGLIQLNDNQLSGCFDTNLSKFCSISFDVIISDGNNFDTPWEDFCKNNDAGACLPNCHIDDWTALKALYERTDGDNWRNNAGWEQVTKDEPSEDCLLFRLAGVTTDVFLERVVMLNLTNNQLSGSIPVELGNLSKLIQLDLSSNQLSGSIPPELGNIDTLKQLDLSGNQLSGNIPPELGNLNLHFLNLSVNQFNSNIPAELGNLTKLENLSLSDNQLSGSIPAELGNLTNLKELWLHDNQLNGSIPSELGNLTDLVNLMLYNNKLSDSIPTELGNLTNLESLWLFNNELSDSIPKELGNLTNLITLRLHNNELSGNIPIELGNLTELQVLWLSNNQLSGSVPSELVSISNLWDFNFTQNQLSGCYPDYLSVWCGLGNDYISYGNNFDAPWEDFCENGLGACWGSYGSISGSVGEDTNNDDFPEFPIRGVTIELFDEDGNLIYAAITDENGYYVFPDLPAGNYVIAQVQPVVFVSVSEGDNIPDTTDATLPNDLPIDNILLVTLAPGEVDEGNDFLEETPCNCNSPTPTPCDDANPCTENDIETLDQCTGEICIPCTGTPVNCDCNIISGEVFIDMNNNGCQDASETTGPAGIEVTIWECDPTTGFPAILVNTIITDAEGGYGFGGGIAPDNCVLDPARTYTVHFRIPDGYNFSERGEADDCASAEANDVNPKTGIIVECTDPIPGDGYKDDHFDAGIVPITQNCHIDDWTALKALYESTDGDNWSYNTGWEEVTGNEPSPSCNLENLYLVDLDNEGRINELTLHHNQLNGSIPAELGNLTNLVYLSLRGNQLSGSIPSELGNLTDLLTLGLHENQLNGSIPAELGNLTKLKSLALQDNELSGSIPFELGNLTDLTHLALFNNQLSSNIPTELSNLTNLRELILSSNELNGSIPIELGNLTKLIDLLLNTNQLSGSIPAELGNLSNLRSLTLSKNQLSGSIPPELGNLTNLSNLILSNNQLSGCYETSLSNLCDKGFENERISDGNNLEATWEDFCTNVLEACKPQNCNIGDWTALKALYENTDGDNWTNNTGWEQITSNTPPADCNLEEMYGVELNEDGRLSELDLSNNGITGDIPTELGNLTNLAIFNIDSNQFTPNQIKNTLELGFDNFDYSPQYFDFGENAIKVINPDSFPANVQLSVPFENDTETVYEWFKNGEVIPGITDSIFNLTVTKPLDAGIYTLNITNTSAPGLEFISEPAYIMVKGYDFYGEPIIENQLIIEFEDASDKDILENIIFPEFGKWAGFVPDSCNCNRELYLYEFPSAETTLERWIELDQKAIVLRDSTEADGGFNYVLSLGEIREVDHGFDVLPNCDEVCEDSLSIHIVDSGYNSETENNPYVKAPDVETCHGVDPDFKDSGWHGTYGINAITNRFDNEAYVSVVPLKIFDENEKATLFDLICSLYYAVDENSDVINISGGYYVRESFAILDSAIQLARDKGLFIVTSAGNDGLNIDDNNKRQYPAYYAKNYDNVISVASIDANGSLSKFSNFSSEAVTLASYGEDILSYVAGEPTFATGTSMAAFFVSKELALEIGTNRNYDRTFEQIRNDFIEYRLSPNDSLKNVTILGEQLNVRLEGIGCTDPNACDYFKQAIIDDGSCEYNLCSKCHLSDWDALKALYLNTGGDNWKRTNNWEILELDIIPDNCDLGDLYGVSLNNEGRVDVINFYNNNLNGNIPIELEGLRELTGLFLAANNLSGKIPDELTNLTKLSQLILTANNLSGSIPESIEKLVNLKRLHLSNNQFSGEIPGTISQLNQLEYLTLDNNQLNGSIPNEIVQLERLRQLNICRNQLNGCYDTELEKLCNIDVCINDGNLFDSEWGAFCLNREGACQMRKATLEIDQQELKIYPNPSQGKLCVELLDDENENNLFSILNLEGKYLLKIGAKRLSDHLYEIDIASLQNGMYILKIQNSDHIYAKKIILN